MNTYGCDDCGWQGPLGDLASIDDIHQRVNVGELMPAGQCPSCGLLVECHDDDVAEWLLNVAVRIMRARGWTGSMNPPAGTHTPAAAPTPPADIMQATRKFLGR